MASAQGRSRHLECALCMEVFTSPRMLPCFHTFCFTCLQQLVRSQQKSDTFPCPTCRAITPIPKDGLKKLQVNFYVEAELEQRSSDSRVCETCHKQSATHKCVECDQLACGACTAIHAAIAATKSHTVLQLKNLAGSGQSQIKVSRERYCATHTAEKIRFFCNQCCTVICRDCKLTAHEGHKTVDLSAKSTKAKNLIQRVTKHSRKICSPDSSSGWRKQELTRRKCKTRNESC